MAIQQPAASHVHIPLSNSTNDLNAPGSTSSNSSVNGSKQKSMRHKGSLRAQRPQVDSSETVPSSHSSIFEALYCSPSNENIAGQAGRASWLGTFITGGTRDPNSGSENGITVQHSILLESPPLRSIHQPTPLETITEQKSIATLRPRLSFLVPHKPSLLLVSSKQDPIPIAEDTVYARRKKSFSFDDITLLRRPSRLLKNSSSSSSSNALPIAQPEVIYPNLPIGEPPIRAPTPPGLPTFNTPAAATYRLRPPTSSFRDLFRLHRTPEERLWVTQTRGLPQGAVMRGEDGTIVRGRWKPNQSGHTGHVRNPGVRGVATLPFHSAPVAILPAAVRTSMENCSTQDGPMNPQIPQIVPPDIGNLMPPTSETSTLPARLGTEGPRDATGSSQLRASLGSRPSRVRLPENAKSGTWVNIVEGCCAFCCGAEKAEDGLLHVRIVPRTMMDGEGGRGPEEFYEGC